MSKYLHFEVGDDLNLRGRALFYVKNKDNGQIKDIKKIININGTSLKEEIGRASCRERV